MTIGGEVKALLDEVEGITAVYRRAWVPEDAQFPYASFLDPVSVSVGLAGDARTLKRRTLIQVDLWQKEAEEDDGLLDAVMDAIDGASITSGRVRVQDATLVPEESADSDIVHHALTVSVARVSSSA